MPCNKNKGDAESNSCIGNPCSSCPQASLNLGSFDLGLVLLLHHHHHHHHRSLAGSHRIRVLVPSFLVGSTRIACEKKDNRIAR